MSAQKEGATQADATSHSSRGSIGEIPYVPIFVGAVKEELAALFGRYPTKMAALLPALWIVQRERGWVSEEAMVEVGQQLELTPAYGYALCGQVPLW